ncbi:hypothetical protein, variant [Verruconis gallopava]|uniref:NAD(P)-binding domain-containing protein n=1 Tax=Verruconis gallopava TaxID=253628 RepID=A0A0D2ARP4_9PEZI|nr:uncharacterized protein PV09_00124 [Verruconis gallopava]XP_016219065.1 hypothetical protein, variant [Verruconis gallopava]KIW09195.1 hypothetical protein PV09_00124 [Verruconis gallopava]KIW09196.1 hypothetical protein, variant [Verruconis gallopava]
MAHLILTGATGLVGSAVLVNLIERPTSEVSKVTVLSRREVPIIKDNPRFETVILKSFTSYDSELLENLKGADGVIWAQGISITQVPRDEYLKITIDYPLCAAKAFASLSDNFKFVYVSGYGASTNPGMFTQPFGKIKGSAELQLLDLQTKLPTLKVYSARPCFVDPSHHSEIEEALKDRRKPFAEKLVPALRPLLRLMPKYVSPTNELGKVLVDLALSDGQELQGEGVEKGRILENSVLQRLYAESVKVQS